MSGGLEQVELGCGCVMDYHTGYAITSCRAHDRRTRAVKVAAALQSMGNWLHETAKRLEKNAERDGGLASGSGYLELTYAAQEAVKAAKAMVDDD